MVVINIFWMMSYFPFIILLVPSEVLFISKAKVSYTPVTLRAGWTRITKDCNPCSSVLWSLFSGSVFVPCLSLVILGGPGCYGTRQFWTVQNCRVHPFHPWSSGIKSGTMLFRVGNVSAPCWYVTPPSSSVLPPSRLFSCYGENTEFSTRSNTVSTVTISGVFQSGIAVTKTRYVCEIMPATPNPI